MCMYVYGGVEDEWRDTSASKTDFVYSRSICKSIIRHVTTFMCDSQNVKWSDIKPAGKPTPSYVKRDKNCSLHKENAIKVKIK
jgi:hypothetical protein